MRSPQPYANAPQPEGIQTPPPNQPMPLDGGGVVANELSIDELDRLSRIEEEPDHSSPTGEGQAVAEDAEADTNPMQELLQGLGQCATSADVTLWLLHPDTILLCAKLHPKEQRPMIRQLAVDRDVEGEYIQQWERLLDLHFKEREPLSRQLENLVCGRLGHEFAYDESLDRIEIDGKPITDRDLSSIMTQVRDCSIKKASREAVKDWLSTEADKRSYHPIRDYLTSLVWDGQDHIAALASYLHDEDEPITYADGNTRSTSHAWLERWLVGAVARAMANHQNVMFVLAGPQGIGKSTFAKWLCPLPERFTSAPIQPDNKDCQTLAADKWIWEVAELGATTGRQHTEALKAFLTQPGFSIRRAYGVFNVDRPMLASFIGTINPSALGFLVDPTGNRRFMVTNLISINRGYQEQIHLDQVWAQAYALFKSGDTGELSFDERIAQNKGNEQHTVSNAVEDVLAEFFEIDPARSDWHMTTNEIINKLDLHAKLTDRGRPLETQIGNYLTKQKLKKKENPKPRKWLGIRYNDGEPVRADATPLGNTVWTVSDL
jgi:hypothetical protein